MRLNKKLLATLLPLTAAGALAPVLSSCNKGSSWVINYGDAIDCLNEKATNYHSINDVKNSVKSHTSPESLPLVSRDQLPNWSDGVQSQQMIYYDLVASHSIFDDTKNQIKFALTWSVDAESKLTMKLDLADGTKVDGVSTIEYTDNESDKLIYIKITSSTSTPYLIRSFNYKNSKLES